MTGSRKSVRILGVDPGSRITGYGVIDVHQSHLRHVASGCIHVRGGDLTARLRAIFDGITAIVDSEDPAVLAVEQVFFHRNAASALKLGQARGAALMAGVTRGLPLFEYSPNQVKQAVTGRGHAPKDQIRHMIKMLLCLRDLPGSDAADALAVAICHGHTSETLARIETSAMRAGTLP
jgi:crossover junction endodeoxyribonuclease RuvC